MVSSTARTARGIQLQLPDPHPSHASPRASVPRSARHARKPRLAHAAPAPVYDPREAGRHDRQASRMARQELEVALPDTAAVTVVEPVFVPAATDQAGEIATALADPHRLAAAAGRW
ncbi:MAG: hypothetical protein MZV64_25990 [Ignavibacteriales bacterium]|nr:hypothetical protein [Ignavibacteriales bacterium]